MSRGRSRHQASRRRMYSARQRDLRERRLAAARSRDDRLGDELAAIEIEEPAEPDASAPSVITLARGVNAA